MSLSERPQEMEGLGISHLPRIESRIKGLLPPYALCGMSIAPLTFLCAEPGFGKSHIADLLAGEATTNGIATKRFCYDEGTPEQACRRIVRACREFSSQSGEGHANLLIIDGVMPPDERQALREAQAIEKVASHDQVIVCIRPESEQLAEACASAYVLRAEDLLFRRGDVDADDWALTGGIPQLVVGLSQDRQMGIAATAGGARYATALEDLLTKTLRDGLPDEDNRVRLAMILLGHGTLDEVEAVAGRCDMEMFTWLAHDMPLFGIDVRMRDFCCHGLAVDAVLSRCLGSLHQAAECEPALVVRACSALATRGDALRSATVCKLCSTERDFALVGCHWGVPYAEVGETRLLDEALRTSRRLEMPDGVRFRLSDLALAEISSPSSELDKVRQRMSEVRIDNPMDERLLDKARLLGACRDLCRDPRLVSGFAPAPAVDANGAYAIEHLKVFRMLVSGRFEEAYSILASDVGIQGARTYPEALLCCDLTVALVMNGGIPDARSTRLLEEAGRFFMRLHRGRQRCYHAALLQAVTVLMAQGRSVHEVEAAEAQAARVGDTLLRIVFLLVEAVRDLRVRALSRAHVRSREAATMARTLGMEYLASSAELVDALSLESMGETGLLGQYCLNPDRPESLLQLGSLAARVVGEGPDNAAYLSITRGTPCPRDTMWLLMLLLNDCGTISELLLSEVPPAWVEGARTVGSRLEALRGEDAPVEAPPAPMPGPRVWRAMTKGTQVELLAHPQGNTNVQVKLLGGFGVWVNGTSLPQTALSRRGARELLLLLALVPGHRMQRYRIASTLWPRSERSQGSRKVYEATGELRKRLIEAGAPSNPILSPKTQGIVGLDQGLISCDVDDFEREARQALEEDKDDFWVLDHARQAAHLYSNGADGRVLALGGEIPARLGELESLYVDAMVAASEAALRLSRAQLAVRYAMDAHRLSGLREDAMLVLVQALRAAGRTHEIREHYSQFCDRLAREQSVLPSLGLRRAVERAIGEPPEAWIA